MNISAAETSALLESLGGTLEPDSLLTEPSSHYSPGVTSNVEDKALALLGAGVPGDQVAAAVGVTPARISQLLAEESFANKVSELKYASLTKHNQRDGEYDKIEDKLLTKLESALPLMVKPESILKAISIVNGAKRRGHTTTNQVATNQNIVNLVLPAKITQQFAVNIDNQVIKAGEQELLTMSSSKLLSVSEDNNTEQLPAEVQNVQNEGGQT